MKIISWIFFFMIWFMCLKADLRISSPIFVQGASSLSANVKAEASGENMFAVWNKGGTSGGQIQYAVFDRSTGVLSKAVTITESVAHSYNPATFLTIRGAGMIAWNGGGASGGDIQCAIYNASANVFENVYTINGASNYLPNIVLNAVGEGIVIWNTGGSSGGEIQYVVYGQQGFGPVQSIEQTASNSYSVRIQEDSQGNFVAIWNTGGSGGGEIQYAVYNRTIQTFSSAQTVKETKGLVCTGLDIKFGSLCGVVTFISGGVTGVLSYKEYSFGSLQFIQAPSVGSTVQGFIDNKAYIVWFSPSYLINVAVFNPFTNEINIKMQDIAGSGLGRISEKITIGNSSVVFVINRSGLAGGGIYYGVYDFFKNIVIPPIHIQNASGYNPLTVLNESGLGFSIWNTGSATGGKIQYSMVTWSTAETLLQLIEKYKTLNTLKGAF